MYYRTIFFINVFLNFAVCGFCQEIFTVNLDRKAIIKTDIPYNEVLKVNPNIGRIEIIVGDFSLDSVAFSIGIYNKNKNDKYNEMSLDYLVIGKFSDSSMSIRRKSTCRLVKNDVVIQVFNSFYKILEIDENGRSIKIKRESVNHSNPYLKYSITLPIDEVESLDGEKFSFSSLYNKKEFIYLHFWATWCVYCIPEMPKLEYLHSKYKSKLSIIGINLDEDNELLKTFLDKYKYTFPNFNIKDNKSLINELELSGYPRGILINSKGEIIDDRCNVYKILDILEPNWK
jgi:thiol-disulfide isomerase/thioredoxin